eukprot:5110672-Amphidinium_carterae.1
MNETTPEPAKKSSPTKVCNTLLDTTALSCKDTPPNGKVASPKYKYLTRCSSEDFPVFKTHTCPIP